MIIAISGKLASGKDTAADIIIERYPFFIKKSFAYQVKSIVADITNTSINDNLTREGKNIIPKLNTTNYNKLLNIIENTYNVYGSVYNITINEIYLKIHHIFDPIFVANDKSLGELQQIISTLFKDIFSPNIWIDYLFNDFKSTDFWIISDLRFPNEADFLLHLNSLIIRLNGDPANIRSLNLDKRNSNHSSEIALDNYPFTFVINNDKSISHLYFSIFSILRSYNPYIFS